MVPADAVDSVGAAVDYVGAAVSVGVSVGAAVSVGVAVSVDVLGAGVDDVGGGGVDDVGATDSVDVTACPVGSSTRVHGFGGLLDGSRASISFDESNHDGLGIWELWKMKDWKGGGEGLDWNWIVWELVRGRYLVKRVRGKRNSWVWCFYILGPTKKVVFSPF